MVLPQITLDSDEVSSVFLKYSDDGKEFVFATKKLIAEKKQAEKTKHDE